MMTLGYTLVNKISSPVRCLVASNVAKACGARFESLIEAKNPNRKAVLAPHRIVKVALKLEY